jgi:hypothetical protein
MTTPKTKTELTALIDSYIADTAPNIKKEEHKEIELAILDRVDARVLTTGTFTHANNPNFLSPFITFTKTVYTTNYLVNITPYDPAPYTLYSYRTSWAITNKTTTGFTAQLKRNNSQGSGRFFYVVINLSNTI